LDTARIDTSHSQHLNSEKPLGIAVVSNALSNANADGIVTVTFKYHNLKSI